ncbi:ABC transporter ATP-binding protein [Oscillospiraceae bacterium MB08-C2-2]|nr:ABC transporter ATP-binding protein [Oscillospiraceae bacterium MB08-C2-2]
MSVLEISNLYVRYKQEALINAVHNVSFRLEKGESLGIVGESGSGKSTLAMTIMGLLDSRADIGGSIHLDSAELLGFSERERDTYRWSKIAIAFQNSLDVLNPVMSVGAQVAECIIKHTQYGKKEAEAKTKALFEMVGLAPNWYEAYPHQLSGGMRQKVLIAMALSCDPEILIVDEPTMALDSVSKQEIIRLLIYLREKIGFSMIVISHELTVIAALTSRTLVMYTGNVVEAGRTNELLREPSHPYTRGLIYSSPSVHPYRDMWGIPGEIHITEENQCPFYSRCNQRIDACLHQHPELEAVSEDRWVACLRGGIVTLLSGTGLSKTYRVKSHETHACRGCDIQIKAGEIVALIGQSGSGKTTLAGILSGILPVDEGKIYFEGRKIFGSSETRKAEGIQMVFQDPLSATNENLTIEAIVREPLDILRKGSKSDRIAEARTALKQVQLPYDDAFLKRKGHSLSGGQRQRVAIARALVMNPKLMIADEISAMLDPSSAANLLRLLKGLQNTRGFSMLYITHDIALARKIADTAYVMNSGNIVEYGAASQVLHNPRDLYMQKLLQDTLLQY